MFPVEIDNAHRNIYQQIYEDLKNKILNRQLKADDKLLSKRRLADQLGVSINSVANAYEQLVAEGYIYTIEKKGYFVEDIAPFVEETINEENLPNDLKETDDDKEGWLSLSHMTADISIFPFGEWMKCQKRAIQNFQNELSEIIHFQGPYIVREEIAKMITISRGVNCQPEQVVIGPGTQLLVRELMEVLKNNTVVAMEDPGYHRIYALLNTMGFDIRTVGLDKKGINLKKAGSDVNLLYVTPSHQLPTGIIMPASRRIELLNWATQGSDRYIIEDDYDSEFKYETNNIPSLQSLDKNQRVIYMGSFSKTMFPGLRVSYMVLPPELLRKYRELHCNRMQDSNALSLYTLYYFINSGGYTRHLKRMNNHYEMKRKVFIDQLKSTFKNLVSIMDIPAGLHVLATFQTGYSYQQIEKRAKKEKLEVFTIKRFILNNTEMNNENTKLILGFANVGMEQIPEAVTRLFRILME